MATILLPPDFKEFLKLLNSRDVEYLLIGGYAVNYYGYPRATADLDIWIAIDPLNTQKMAAALSEFGFAKATISLLQEPGKIIRMGVPPIRIEVLTSVSGVDFPSSFRNRLIADIDGVSVNLISLADLKTNKKAAGRLKDLADLEQLD
jgi:predicted nucleotidyltransferase